MPRPAGQVTIPRDIELELFTTYILSNRQVKDRHELAFRLLSPYRHALQVKVCPRAVLWQLLPASEVAYRMSRPTGKLSGGGSKRTRATQSARGCSLGPDWEAHQAHRLPCLLVNGVRIGVRALPCDVD
jgi:hypothetical protein